MNDSDRDDQLIGIQKSYAPKAKTDKPEKDVKKSKREKGEKEKMPKKEGKNKEDKGKDSKKIDEDNTKLKKEREQEEKEYAKIKGSTYDPFKNQPLDKPHGKIAVGEDDNYKKYLYFIKKLSKDHPQYEPFDWKAKGVVRHRFEAIKREHIPSKEKGELQQAKDKLEDVQKSIGELEAFTGKLEEVKSSLMT
jgi:hypothetical protein